MDFDDLPFQDYDDFMETLDKDNCLDFLGEVIDLNDFWVGIYEEFNDEVFNE